MIQQPNLAPAEIINEIFGRFVSIYETAWTDVMSTDQLINIKRVEWSTTLAGFTLKQVRTAIELCKKRYEWPPNTAQFYKLLINQFPERAHYAAYQDYNPAAFLIKKSSPEIAERELNKMYGILGIKRRSKAIN